MARTQRVASFEKRLSTSAAGSGRNIADQDEQRQQSAEPGTPRKEVQSLRIEQQAREHAPWRRRGYARPEAQERAPPAPRWVSAMAEHLRIEREALSGSPGGAFFVAASDAIL